MVVNYSSNQLLDIRRSLHDLTQPLAILCGLVDLLLLELEADDPKLRDVQLISEQLEKVREIIREVRCLARGAPGEPVRAEPQAHP